MDEFEVQLVNALAQLHEDVMQRVFATGLGLEALAGQVTDETLAMRLRAHIADLDETLDEIRMTLFALRKGSARAG